MTTTLRKAGEVARELCVNHSEVIKAIAKLGLTPALIIDGAARFDDAAFNQISVEIIAQQKVEGPNGQ